MKFGVLLPLSGSHARVDHFVFAMFFRGGVDKLYGDMRVIAKDVFPTFR
jgi:hypothetical protein